MYALLQLNDDGVLLLVDGALLLVDGLVLFEQGEEQLDDRSEFLGEDRGQWG